MRREATEEPSTLWAAKKGSGDLCLLRRLVPAAREPPPFAPLVATLAWMMELWPFAEGPLFELRPWRWWLDCCRCWTRLNWGFTWTEEFVGMSWCEGEEAIVWRPSFATLVRPYDCSTSS